MQWVVSDDGVEWDFINFASREEAIRGGSKIFFPNQAFFVGRLSASLIEFSLPDGPCYELFVDLVELVV